MHIYTFKFFNSAVMISHFNRDVNYKFCIISNNINTSL